MHLSQDRVTMCAKSNRDPEPKLRLDQITTVWSMLGDPAKFIMRYAPAIQRYFVAMIRDHHDAEEAIQDFLVRVMQSGFVNADAQRGRFRDYLRTAVRHAALAQMRRAAKNRGHKRLEPASPEKTLSDSFAAAAVVGDASETIEQEWVSEWRRCVLERAWRALERFESRTGGRSGGGSLPHTTLRLVVDHPDEDSKSLAARAATLTGQALNPESFRQRLSRARRVFARLLVQEVAETLQNPAPADVEEELVDLGLMPYVAHYLPNDWHSSGSLPDWA